MDRPAQTPLQLPLRDVYSVSRLNREAKNLLEGGFPPLWVEGEISNLARPGSGHLYFCLKDGQAQIRCAMFRTHARLLKVNLREGMQVMARARVSLYEGRGEFQLLVEHLEDSGEGALRRAFDALKQRLAQEGLFDSSRKRPLPTLARRVGVITSPTGAAIRDIVTTFRRRFPAIALLIYPVPVQGAGAAEKIAAALQLASARNECGALLLARGGGSLEDLWPFNEEIVARAIAACAIPVVCGVGHESDISIADLAADVRAPTPTAAAELLSPNAEQWLARFREQRARLAQLAARMLREKTQRLDGASGRLLHPQARLDGLRMRLNGLTQRLLNGQLRDFHARRQGLDTYALRLRARAPYARIAALEDSRRQREHRLRRAMQARLERERARLAHAVATLQAYSPLATLTRGFAIVEHDGKLVRAAGEVKPGDAISARLARGRVIAVVKSTFDD